MYVCMSTRARLMTESSQFASRKPGTNPFIQFTIAMTRTITYGIDFGKNTSGAKCKRDSKCANTKTPERVTRGQLRWMSKAISEDGKTFSAYYHVECVSQTTVLNMLTAHGSSANDEVANIRKAIGSIEGFDALPTEEYKENVVKWLIGIARDDRRDADVAKWLAGIHDEDEEDAATGEEKEDKEPMKKKSKAKPKPAAKKPAAKKTPVVRAKKKPHSKKPAKRKAAEAA
jgi:hypothetical protein